MSFKFLKYILPAILFAGLPTLSFASGNLEPTDPVGITFWIISIAMVAAATFFFLESLRFEGKWRTSLVVGGLVCMGGSSSLFLHERCLGFHWSITYCI